MGADWNDDLSYERHISLYTSYLGKSKKSDLYWKSKAAEMQAYTVIDALTRVSLDILASGTKLSNVDGYHHFVLGSGKRSRFIWNAFRYLVFTIPPSRTDTLSEEEATEASRALNDIYINLIGAIDNFAYTLLFQNDPEGATRYHPTSIVLFGKISRIARPLAEYRDKLQPFDEWYWSVRDLRDPVAHRIPLMIPPSIQDSETRDEFYALKEKYENNYVEYFKYIAGSDLSDAERLYREVEDSMTQMRKVGKFAPIIVHDPRAAPTPVYPSVTGDVAMFVRISREILTFLASPIE